MFLIRGSRGLTMPELRTAAAWNAPGGTTNAISTQTGTQTGDLTIVFAVSTTGVTPDEATPGALMTTVDTLNDARRTRIAYRIFDGTTNLTTWTQTTSHGLVTIKAGTFHAAAPFSDGGAGYLNSSEPDNYVVWPSMTAPPNAKSWLLQFAWSNPAYTIGPWPGTTDLWNISAGFSSRCMYKHQTTAVTGANVNHTSGTAAQTAQFSAYLRGHEG